MERVDATGTLSCRKGSADLLYRMHESVLDYTALLGMEWDQRLSAARSELERETVLMDMWEQVVERGQHGEVTAYERKDRLVITTTHHAPTTNHQPTQCRATTRSPRRERLDEDEVTTDVTH